ncbi:SMP-30/gluconolactonase/LRE family protein [Colwellia asteriadis]|uniref:SMP-30/gluconolactonase/LRE family protein n=1 Tax=Colwellia asteriadis TaxID=517723 RepID=A0ABP3WQD5_9GAMM
MKQNNLTKVALVCAMTILASACTKNSTSTTAQQVNNVPLYQSTDWITDGVFTQGVEGPAVAQNGTLYAVNYQQEGTIGKVSGQSNAELLVALPNGSVGNGIRFDSIGNMYIADYVNHNVLKIAAQDLANNSVSAEKVQVYAHSAQMNQPNDIAIMANGILFASDPNWANGSGQLWRINTSNSAQGSSQDDKPQGEAVLLEANMGTTNGVEVSPDNNTLYVNESVQRKVWQYSLTPQGDIEHKKLLISFDDFGLDGMRTDKQGNLYIARYGKGVIAIVSPQGELLREVQLTGQHPTNVAFGGKDGKTVFVTMQKRGAIESFRSEFAGREFIGN